MKLHKSLPRSQWAALLTVAIMVALGIVTSQVVVGDDPPPYPDDPDQAFIETGPRIVSVDTARANLATKEAIDNQRADERKAAQDLWTSGPQAKLPSSDPIPNYPESPFAVGIFQEAGPMPSGWGALYYLVNRWHGVINGDEYIAMAGLKFDTIEPTTVLTPAQGVLVLTIVPGNGNPVLHEVYTTPHRCGQVQVLSESGNKLLLSSSILPAWFEFDLPTRTWTQYGVSIPNGGYVLLDPPCAIVTPIAQPTLIPGMPTPTIIQPPGTPPAAPPPSP